MIKILVVPSDKYGIGKYRSVDPHVHIDKNNEDIHVDIDYKPELTKENLIKYDIIHAHRCLGSYDKFVETVKMVKDLGVKLIIDIDDFWAVEANNPHFNKLKRNFNNTISVLKNAPYITVSTKELYNEVLPYNKNVYVLENGINPEDKQFKSEKTESDLTRFYFLGGSSHLRDIELMYGLPNMLFNDTGIKGKSQIGLCGYNTQGRVPFMDKKTNSLQYRQMLPTETTWFKYENIFTNSFRAISPAYRDWLLKFIVSDTHEFTNEPYRRFWTKDISVYGELYKEFDVSLAPLVDSKFNACKSHLKALEAGFSNTGLICSNVKPYNQYLVDGKNCLMVNSNKKTKGWYKAIKKLVNNTNLRKDLTMQLSEDMSEYSLDKLNINRVQVYKKIKDE